MPDVSQPLPPKTVAVIVALYVDCGFSTYRIAADVGIDRQRVGRLLRKAGVALPQRGQGRRRPLRVAQAATEDMLRTLYVDLRMPSTEIGAALGISDRLIRSRLRRAGISLRSKGKWDRRDRTDAEKDDVSRLYVDQELAAETVGGKLGVSRRIVLRSAHTYGLPVRPGGMRRAFISNCSPASRPTPCCSGSRRRRSSAAREAGGHRSCAGGCPARGRQMPQRSTISMSSTVTRTSPRRSAD
jgi:hypothetical protein